jgi:hypothetical protein
LCSYGSFLESEDGKKTPKEEGMGARRGLVLVGSAAHKGMSQNSDGQWTFLWALSNPLIDQGTADLKEICDTLYHPQLPLGRKEL